MISEITKAIVTIINPALIIFLSLATIYCSRYEHIGNENRKVVIKRRDGKNKGNVFVLKMNLIKAFSIVNIKKCQAKTFIAYSPPPSRFAKHHEKIVTTNTTSVAMKNGSFKLSL